MEISSPQQKEHMWKYDRKSQNRTAKRGNKDRFRLKKKQLNQMPDLTYASFEVELTPHSTCFVVILACLVPSISNNKCYIWLVLVHAVYRINCVCVCC